MSAPVKFDYMTQVRSWSEEWQVYWAKWVDALQQADPARYSEKRTAEFFAFRQVRSEMLRDGALLLEQVPGWDMTGRARDADYFATLRSDDSFDRLQRGFAKNRCTLCGRLPIDCACPKPGATL